MRKNLWLLGVAVAALSSCTQSEVLDVPERPNIGFDTFVGKQTRAAGFQNVSGLMLVGSNGASNDLTRFWVFGSYSGEEHSDRTPFDGGDDDNIYWDSTNNTFTYTNPRQWYLGSYQFAAYSNGNEKLDEINVTGDNRVTADLTTPTLTFTDYVNSGTKDLVVAIPAAITKTETNMRENVALTFNHMLSCIELSFTNNSANFYLDFQEVQFSVKSKGTCAYSLTTTPNVSWTNVGEAAVYDLKTNIYDSEDDDNNNPDVLLKPSVAANLYAFVIPQENQQVSLTFKIVTYEKVPNGNTGQGGEPLYDYVYRSTTPYTASLAIPTATYSEHASWQPGFLYRYAATVSGNLHYINFDVTSVEPWDQSVTTGMSPSETIPVTP